MRNFLIIFIMVILVFAGIVLFTSFLGMQFGKAAEMTGLTLAAVILLVLYIKSKRS